MLPVFNLWVIMRYKRKRYRLVKQKYLKAVTIAFIVLVLIAALFIIISVVEKNTETSDAVNAVLEKGILNVGLRSDLGPLCSYNIKTSEFEGFEKDVADEIIKRLFDKAILVNYIEVSSKTKTAMLRRGDIDIALTASVATKTSGINHTLSYYSDASAFLITDERIENMHKLEGKTIAIVYGTPQTQEITKGVTAAEGYLNSMQIEVNIKTYASYPEAVCALQNGFVDAVCASDNILKLYGKKGMIILAEYFLPSKYCVEVSDSLGAFYRAINPVINQMQSDGTLDRLLEKWGLIKYPVSSNPNQ